MSAVKGRTIKVSRPNTTSAYIAGVRTKSVAINGEGIDVTDDDSAGWRELLDDPAELQISISVSGIVKDDSLREESLSSTDRMQPTSFQYPDGGEISGNFYLSSYTETGEYNGAVTFEAEFQSSGVVAYTPAT